MQLLALNSVYLRGSRLQALQSLDCRRCKLGPRGWC